MVSLWKIGLATIVLMATHAPAMLAVAYEAVLETVPAAYEVIQLVGEPTVTKVILGELNDAPEMFEIMMAATSTLALELRAVPVAATQPIFSGIIIKQKEVRGIAEIARLPAAGATWNTLVDGATGLPYLAGPFFSEVVTPGIYRIEVSNPNNQGKYLLVLGYQADEQSYSASLRSIVSTYEFYGVSSLQLFNSPYVHYPLGIILLLLLLGVTVYKTRRRFLTVTPTTHA